MERLQPEEVEPCTATLPARTAPRDAITMVGLVFESSLGLRRAVEPTLQCLCGPSAPWFEVMIRLARSPGSRLRMSDLAAQTALTPSGLTRAVDRLVELRLVTRETSAADRRGAFAALTDSGRSAMDEVLPKHETFLSELLAGVFEPGEEEILISLLRRLRDHVHPGGALRTPTDHEGSRDHERQPN